MLSLPKLKYSRRLADSLWDFKGVNMLCDIGNGTMNVMYINNRKPVPSKCFTEKYGTHQCMLAVRESVMQRFVPWMIR